MSELFEANAASCCMSIMKKLDHGGAASENIKEILAEVCEFFGSMYGFMYYRGGYHRSFQGTIYAVQDGADANQPPELDLEKEEWLWAELKQRKMIVDLNSSEEKLEAHFRKLLGLDCYALLPVVGEDKRLIALVGIGDRKEHGERTKRINLPAFYSLFVIISNHIKVRASLSQIENTEKTLSAIADNMGVDIYVNDFITHEMLYVNRSMAMPYGGPEAMIGDKCWRVLYDDKTEQCEYCPQKKIIDEDGNPTKVYSWNYERPFDHSWFRVLSAAFRWGDGRLAHIVSSIDITENVRNQELIRTLAEYDNLTGISNRRKLIHDGEEMLRQMKEDEHAYVLFFDLNKFKQVNDQYGHRAGDELLGKVGAYLKEDVQFGDCSYRYGGDEFILLFRNCTKEQVILAAKRIQEYFSKPWKLSCCEPICRASIGIAEYPADGTTMDDLIGHADEAMYVSKQKQGQEIVFYQDLPH